MTLFTELFIDNPPVPKCCLDDIKNHKGMGLSVSCDQIKNTRAPADIWMTMDIGSMTCCPVEDVVKTDNLVK
jgi:hypothetical protein